MPITDTTVDMLTAFGGTILTGVITVVLAVLGFLLRKQVVELVKHIVDVVDDRTLARDPERARIVAELRRARLGRSSRRKNATLIREGELYLDLYR